VEGGFWPGLIVTSIGGAPTLFIQLSGANVIISWSPSTRFFIGADGQSFVDSLVGGSIGESGHNSVGQRKDVLSAEEAVILVASV